MSLTQVNFIVTEVSELKNNINTSCQSIYAPFKSILLHLYRMCVHTKKKNKNIQVFLYLKALMFSYLHSSPSWNKMEQHRDIICQFPLSLPC